MSKEAEPKSIVDRVREHLEEIIALDTNDMVDDVADALNALYVENYVPAILVLQEERESEMEAVAYYSLPDECGEDDAKMVEVHSAQAKILDELIDQLWEFAGKPNLDDL